LGTLETVGDSAFAAARLCFFGEADVQPWLFKIRVRPFIINPPSSLFKSGYLWPFQATLTPQFLLRTY
jgi:hypothetical protein